MNVQKLTGAMETLKNRIPRGLASSSIVSLLDGQALMEYNSDPIADALITQATIYMQNAFSRSAMGHLGDYYVLDLASHLTGVCILFKEHWWGVVVDKNQVSLGMLFNVIVPEAIKNFNEAVAG